MQVRRFLTLILLFCSLVSLEAKIHTVRSLPNIYNEKARVWVSNLDNIISKADEKLLNEKIEAYEYRSSREIVVVAVKSIGTVDSKVFANQLFNRWKIGKAELNNGLLILFVGDKREIVFETGTGIEQRLTDDLCYQIQQQRMIPHFQEGNNSRGLVEGVDAVIQFFNTGKLQAVIDPEIPDLLSNDNVLQPVEPEDETSSDSSAGTMTDDETFGYLVAFFLIPAILGVLIVWYSGKIKYNPQDQIKAVNKISLRASIVLIICCAGIPAAIAIYIFRYFYVMNIEKELAASPHRINRPQPIPPQYPPQPIEVRPIIPTQPARKQPASPVPPPAQPTPTIDKEERARLKLLEKERERERQREKEREERRKLGRRSSW